MRPPCGLVRLAVLAAALLLLGAGGAAPPARPAAAAESCHRIMATGVGQDLGGGRTTAQIMGGGLLQGTTAAQFDIAVSGTLASFAGTLTFTTQQGTLTVAVTGTLDLSTGAFSATGTVTSATGSLAGASGALTFTGVEDLSTGRFTESVTGTICVDLAP